MKREEWDSNPRETESPPPAFQTGSFDLSDTLPNTRDCDAMEGGGFEPPEERCPSSVFETDALNLSASLPRYGGAYRIRTCEGADGPLPH